MPSWLLLAQVVLTLLHCIAVASTCFRLRRRTKIDQLGWDDYAAGFALGLNIMYFPTLWFPNDDPYTIIPATNRRAVVIAIIDSWLFNIAWGLVLWVTRISIGLSITRVFPKKTRYYHGSLVLVFALVATAIALEALRVIKCTVTYAAWSITPPYLCNTGIPSYITFACLDVISDLLLVIAPLWALWDKTNLTDTARRVINIGFAANGLAAIASLITGVIVVGEYTKDTLVAIRITSHIMSVISLMACNSLVVVTSFYRHFRSRIDGPPRLPHLPRLLRELTDNTAQDSSSTRSTNTSDFTNSVSVGYTTDRSGQSTSDDSLRLTLTVVRTDPSFVFLNQTLAFDNVV